MEEAVKSDVFIKNLSNGVDYYLIQKGFNPKYTGFLYISDIVCYYLLQDKSAQVPSKTVYEYIAKRYEKSLSSINRCVRFAVVSNKANFEGKFNGKFSVKCCLQYLVLDIRNNIGFRNLLP